MVADLLGGSMTRRMEATMKIWTTTHETETEYGVVVREQSGTQHRYALLIVADPDEDDCLEAAKRDVRRYLDLSPYVEMVTV